MTARVSYLIVALEHEVSEDDAQNLLTAIAQLRNVARVAPEMSNPGEWTTRQRARHEIASKIDRVLYDEDRS